MLTTILVFLFTLTVLIGVHEAGHYWVARWCGVKVLRFSIGFGKPLFGWRNRDGTEFAVAPIPLGGYVKMLDEREGNVDPADLPRAHNRQSPGKRIAIAAAGPAANFIFAVLVFWVIALLGTSVARPWVAPVPEDSVWSSWPSEPAEIRAVDERAVNDWREVHLALLNRLGTTGDIELRLEGESGAVYRASHPVERWLARVQDPDPIAELGLTFWQPDRPPVLGDIIAEGPAAAAGLQSGDRIVAVEGNAVASWNDWVSAIQARPGETTELVIERSGDTRTLTVTPRAETGSGGAEIGRVGVYAMPLEQERFFRTVRHGPVAAVGAAFRETGETIGMTLGFLGKMLTGQASVQNLSGPVSIAQVAGDSAGFGMVPFLSFLALLSISLGILNLLPIPVLDGGHILYYLVELVRGRPLSERAQGIGAQVGIVLLIGVMVIAFTNDFNRLW